MADQGADLPYCGYDEKMTDTKPTLKNQFDSPVYLSEQIKAIESEASEYTESGLSVLMERAGAALFEHLQQQFADQVPYHIVCGSGNNGGDGFVLARLAMLAGVDVIVYINKEPSGNDAELAYKAMLKCDVSVRNIDQFSPISGVIVDCIFGTGLNRAPQEPWSGCIELINRLDLPVIAVDVPSGLSADRGCTPGVVIEANLTLTFIADKPGLLTGAGPRVCRKLIVNSLGVESNTVLTNVYRVTRSTFEGCFPKRPKDSHKGNFGHVLVVGGDRGYGGAALLAATAALRTGAGLVSVITHPDHAGAFIASRPELMVNALASPLLKPDLTDQLLNRATVIVLGPGLGQGTFGNEYYNHVLQHIQSLDKPAILDADALNLLAINPVNVPSAVLTPHPGEASRLLKCSTEQINADRLASVQRLAEQYSAVALLKGAGSLICDRESVFISNTGNAGMASGGMGDVLCGIIAGLIAQGFSVQDALPLAVWLHGTAGDNASRREGETGLIASDLITEVRPIINSLIGRYRPLPA